MHFNVVDNVFVEELRYFFQNSKNKQDHNYNFKGCPEKFEVIVDPGVKPVRFENNTFYYLSISGRVLTADSIDYLMKKNLYLCHVINVSFLDNTLTNDMNQTEFLKCYFRNAKLDNIKIIGSYFVECNFKSATFNSVLLDYARFQRCKVEYSQLQECIDLMHSNKKVDLTENLLSNAYEMRISSDVEDIKDTLKTYKLNYYKDKSLLSKNEHYSKRTFSERVYFSLRYFFLYLEKYTFGFNLKVKRILFSIILVSFLFTLFYLSIFRGNEGNILQEGLLLSFETLIGRGSVDYVANPRLYIGNYFHNIIIYVLYGSLLIAIIKKVDK